MDISRRKFFRIAGGASAATIVSVATGKELFMLKEASTQEAGDIAKQFGNIDVRYSADVMCPSECSLEMWIKDGTLSKIYGNTHCSYNDGIVCAKGSSGAQLVYSPQRIKYPMIRIGERGEAKFRKASWEEAIDYISTKLTKIKKEHGPEAVIMDAGDVTDRDPYWRFAFAYGTPNAVEHGSICDTPRRHGPKLMFGGKRIEPDVMRPVPVRQADGSLKEDYTYKSRLIIYNGWNPFVATRINYESRGTVGAKVENGCKIVVIDPSHTNTAAQADMWLSPRAGTDPDLFAAMLRYILENNDNKNPEKNYIDWDFKKYSLGWEDFEREFKSWWNKKDPINNMPYFTLEWAANRTGLPQEKIEELSHLFGITKPAALIWGMQSPGHHFNGSVASVIGTALNVITGNFDVPGGAIDTELVKWNKGGKATGKWLKKRKVKRKINGIEVEGEQENLQMDAFGDWPAGWDDVVGDYPRRFMDGVTLNYGPFKGHKYPIKGYILRTGNSVMTAGAPEKWKEGLTAKDATGNYKVELNVFIDTLFLESAYYADVILPEASYAERISLSDVYPSHSMGWLRDQVIKPLHESKTPFDIMIALTKALHKKGDKDIKPEDFWERYTNEEDFWNEALVGVPGRYNIGQPLRYPKFPEGYKLIGTPDSLEKGNVTIDHAKKVVKGVPVTVKWLREHHGVATWPMSWYRYRKWDSKKKDWVHNGVFPRGTKSKKIEFVWDWTDENGNRKGRYSKYNKRLEESGVIPRGLKEIGFKKFSPTFFWFETIWNPHTNPAYKKYIDEYPFQLISGRVHQSMTATQMIPWLGETPVEGTWMPLNNEFEFDMLEARPGGIANYKIEKMKFKPGTWCVGTVLINASDAKKIGVTTGDMLEVENPFGNTTKGKAFVSEGIRPGVIKIGFGTGGRFSKGMGATYKQKDYTPNHSELVDPNALSPIMGIPVFADMIVKLKKI